MNKFIVIKSRNLALHEEAKQRVRDKAIGLISYNPSRIRVREFRESLTLFVNLELADTGGFGKNYVHTSNEETFAFDGLPYWQGMHADGNWAEQLRGQWTADQRMIETIYGTWAMARYDVREGGRILSDFSGMTPLFYWKDNDYLAISPRQMLLAGICGDLEYDLEQMAWLTGQANMIGDKTVWKNVSHLPPQWTLKFNTIPGDLQFQVEEREIWSQEIDIEPDAEQIAVIRDSMLAQCDALSRLPLPPLRIDITGGLDSRLVAALIAASPMADRVEYLRTSGSADGHEVQVGAAVAAKLDMKHVVLIPGHTSTTPQSILNEVRASVFRYEASICPNDGFMGATKASRVVLTGSAGEIYRRHCKPHMRTDVRSEAELRTLFSDYHQKTDPLNVEKNWVAEAQREGMRELAVKYHRRGVDLNDVTDIFFMRYRLPLWNGLMMNNIFGAVRVYPLVNYFAAKYAFAKGYQARVGDRIHMEIMLSINPDLCAMPFLGYTWSEALRAYASSKGVEVARAPFPVTGAKSLNQHGGHLHVMMTEGWELARSYLLDRADSRLWDVIDRARVEAVFKTGAGGFSGVVPIKQIFALLGMQAAMCGDSVRTVDGRPDTLPKLDGATAAELFL